MAGNNSYVVRKPGCDLLKRGDQAAHAASAAEVDEREADHQEIIAHVYDIGFGEEDDTISVRVACLKMHDLDVFSVEVDGDVVVKGKNWQGRFGLWGHLELDRAHVACRAALLQPLAHIVVGNDGGLFLKVLVGISVVQMVMGVDDESD